MTALYFHGLSIEVLTDVYDITVKRSYNSVHLRKHNVFYVDNDIYELGLTIVETLMGNKVKTYDVEDVYVILLDLIIEWILNILNIV